MPYCPSNGFGPEHASLLVESLRIAVPDVGLAVESIAPDSCEGGLSGWRVCSPLVPRSVRV